MRFSDYAERYETIRLARSDDGVLELTMHSRGGEAAWGISERSLHNELGHAFAAIASDPENKVVVMTGTGGIFCVALDPDEPAPEDTVASMWDRITLEGMRLLENLLAIPVPVIAAVNGPAHVHAELAALADIVLAAEHAEFADLAHFPNGVVPGDGVHVVWPMLLGPNRGRVFLLTGERLSAEEARALGIVKEVLPADQLMPRAREIAAQIAAKPIRVLRHTRTVLVRDLRRRIREDLDLGLALEGLAFV